MDSIGTTGKHGFGESGSLCFHNDTNASWQEDVLLQPSFRMCSTDIATFHSIVGGDHSSACRGQHCFEMHVNEPCGLGVALHGDGV